MLNRYVKSTITLKARSICTSILVGERTNKAGERGKWIERKREMLNGFRESG